MVNRTAELVLGILGAAFNAIGAILGVLYIFSVNEAAERDLYNNPEVSMEEADSASFLAGAIGWYFVVVCIAAIIMGVIGVIILRKNKRSIGSGVLFIVAGALSAVLSIFLLIVPAILYLVAGILAIVRKPIDTNDNTIESY